MTEHRHQQKKQSQSNQKSHPIQEDALDAEILNISNALEHLQNGSSSLRQSDMLYLQRTIGNRRLSQLVSQDPPNNIQRLFGKKKKKPEISGPFDVKKNGKAFDKSKIKDMGYSEDPVNVQPNLSFEDLKTRAKIARSTNDPLIKAQFLAYFSEHYAPHLTGELEYFQFLAQKVAYMDLQPGDILGANISTSGEGGSMIDEMLKQEGMETATDTESNYASKYVVESKYSNEAGLNAFLILPADGDKEKNALVLFRGTGKNTMGAKRGEASGALADTDYGGVGRVAFHLGLKEMKGWLDTAKDYHRITISGHSLGGAMAERFYVMASKLVPGKLRLITYQGAAIDRIGTVGDVMDNDDPQLEGAKATRVVARGDIVPLGGMAHVPAQKVKYSSPDGGKFNPKESHLQIELVKQQLNKALDKPVKKVTEVVSKQKKGGTNFTKTVVTAGKHLASLIGHSVAALNPKWLYNMIRSGVKKGKETN